MLLVGIRSWCCDRFDPQSASSCDLALNLQLGLYFHLFIPVAANASFSNMLAKCMRKDNVVMDTRISVAVGQFAEMRGLVSKKESAK